MAFQFKRKESVNKGVRRLCRQGIKKSLANLQKGDRLEAIHSVRKEIKKLRAVLRLVRTKISGSAYRKGTEGLREAAGHLAAARDSQVIVKALDDLIARSKTRLSKPPFSETRAILVRDCREEARRFEEEASAKIVGRIFRKLARHFKALKVQGDGWPAICSGLKSSYSRGRQTHELVFQNSTPENFHQWRKRVKDLSCHLQLLRPIWPEQMGAAAEELENLSEQLGDDHDLLMLRQAITDERVCKGREKEVETLRGLIDLRQRELQTAALTLGARFYAEKPSLFCKRLENYWKIWCREKSAQKRECMAQRRLRMDL